VRDGAREAKAGGTEAGSTLPASRPLNHLFELAVVEAKGARGSQTDRRARV
jgi:hypothetical protein